VLMANPQLAQILHNAFTKIGADPMKFVAGSPSQQINPKTGMPMFGFFSSIFSGGSIGSILGAIAGAALAPATGGLSLAAAGALGGGLGGFAGSALTGGSLKQDLTSGITGGVGGYLGGGSLLNGADAVANSATDALGGVGTYGAGQTIGSELSGLGSSISDGISSIGSDISGAANSVSDLFSGAGNTVDPAINGGGLQTAAGIDYNTIAAGGTPTASGAGAGSLVSTPSLIAPDASVGAGVSADSSTINGGDLLTPAGQATNSIINPSPGASPAQLGPYNLSNTAATGTGKSLMDTLNSAPTWLAPAASLASGGLQYLGTQNAISAEQQAQAKQQAIEAPYVNAGNTAEAQQTNLVENPAAQLAYVKNNPLYNSLATQATNTLEANQAAQGKVGSGGTAAALQDQLLQLGTGLVNNQVSNLGQITNTGAAAAGATGVGALSTGAGIASGQQAAGQNLAGGVVGASNNVTAGYNNQISTALALARLNALQGYSPATIQGYGG
jgi:hypothetical protein